MVLTSSVIVGQALENSFSGIIRAKLIITRPLINKTKNKRGLILCIPSQPAREPATPLIFEKSL
jgi:hypothetical protein